MKIKFAFLLFFSLWTVGKSFATDQVYDVLVHNDTVYVIFSRNILEARDYPLNPLIWEFHKDTLTRQKLDFIIGVTRWCIRGYVAEWEIQNDSLLLKKLYRGGTISGEVNLNYIFEDRETKNGVFADWYSGILRAIPHNLSYYDWYFVKNIDYIFIVENGRITVKHKRNRETHRTAAYKNLRFAASRGRLVRKIMWENNVCVSSQRQFPACRRAASTLVANTQTRLDEL